MGFPSLTSIIKTLIALPGKGLQKQREHTAAVQLNQNLQKAHNLAVNYATAMDITYFEQDLSDITINGEECTAYVVEYGNGMTFAIPISHKTGRVLDIDETVEAKQGKYGGPVEIGGLTIQRLDPSLNFVEYVSDSRNQASLGRTKIMRANIVTTKFSNGKNYKVELEAKTMGVKRTGLQVASDQTEDNFKSIVIGWKHNLGIDRVSRYFRAEINDDQAYWKVSFDNQGYVSTIDLHEVYDWSSCPDNIKSTSSVYFNDAYPAHTEGGGATNNVPVETKAKESYSQAFKLGTDVQIGLDETLQEILNYGKPTLVAAGRAASHARSNVFDLHRI